MQNIEALNIALSPAQVEYLEGVVPFDAGFPHNITVCWFPKSKNHSQLTCYTVQGDGSKPNRAFAMVAQTDTVVFPAPIVPKKKDA